MAKEMIEKGTTNTEEMFNDSGSDEVGDGSDSQDDGKRGSEINGNDLKINLPTDSENEGIDERKNERNNNVTKEYHSGALTDREIFFIKTHLAPDLTTFVLFKSCVTKIQQSSFEDLFKQLLY